MEPLGALWQKCSVFAAWLNNFDPFIFQIGGFGPRWYGLSYVVSALIGYRLYFRLAQRGYTDIGPARVADFITWIGLFGVLLGGRLGWILWYGRFQYHAPEDHVWWLRIWEGGMSSHGGILGIVVVTFILSRRWKVSWTSIGDSLCVVAPVGLFLVRCANFINGELFGNRTEVAWSVKFAAELRENVDALEAVGGNPELAGDAERIITAAQHDPTLATRLREVLPARHPSQLYEALLEGVFLFVVLWLLRTRCRMPRGVLTGLFFILYAAVRIFGEFFRVPDPAWSVGQFSAGQVLSFYMLGIGALFLGWGLWRRRYEVADEKPTALV